MGIADPVELRVGQVLRGESALPIRLSLQRVQKAAYHSAVGSETGNLGAVAVTAYGYHFAYFPARAVRDVQWTTDRGWGTAIRCISNCRCGNVTSRLAHAALGGAADYSPGFSPTKPSGAGHTKS